jgi:hypothetical protein
LQPSRHYDEQRELGANVGRLRYSSSCCENGNAKGAGGAPTLGSAILCHGEMNEPLLWVIAVLVPLVVMVTGMATRGVCRVGNARFEDLCVGVDLTVAAMTSLMLFLMEHYRLPEEQGHEKPKWIWLAVTFGVLALFAWAMLLMLVQKTLSPDLDAELLTWFRGTKLTTAQRRANKVCVIWMNILGFVFTSVSILLRGAP